jgi:glycosyltransferase involved in cell wall biosynthesis
MVRTKKGSIECIEVAMGEYDANVRVGIDYWPATTHAPGVGRYARELVRALAALRGDHALSLLQCGIGRQVVTDLGLDTARATVRRRRLPVPRRLLATPWFPAADTLLGGVAVFHHVVPGVTRVRQALQTFALSEIPARGSAQAVQLATALRPMDAVLVFGAAAAQEAAGTLDIPDESLRIVPVGSDHWRRDAEPIDLPTEPSTLLVLGSPRAARHPETILAAWDTLRARGIDCRLRFVGGPSPQGGDFDRLVTAREGVVHDLPRESELPQVVSRGAVLVHLNEAEATAVTPLEAFSFGLAVVASDLPAFREALDGEATLLQTDDLVEDPGLLADAIAHALDGAADEAARARRRAVAARFTWQRNAEATLAIWNDLVAARTSA